MTKVQDLAPAEYNPRKISEKQLAALKKAMVEFGDLSGIVINVRTGNMVGGHQRIKNLEPDWPIEKRPVNDSTGTVATGYIETPTGRWSYREVDWELGKEKAANIAANKHGGEWDLPKLDMALLELIEFDIDIELTGFDAGFVEMIGKRAQSRAASDENRDIQQSATLDKMKPTAAELRELNGRKVLVQFSGGKDSAAASLWARKYLPDAEIELTFVDMGADYVGFQLYLERFAAAVELPLTVLRSKVGMIDHLLENGKWPHFINPYCHGILHSTLDEYYANYDSKKVIIFRGGRLQERQEKSAGAGFKDRFATFSNMPDYRFFQPLYFTDKGSSDAVLDECGAPVWDGYSYGLQRTACRICPGQKAVAYAAMRANYPDVWEELLEMQRRLGVYCWQKYHADGRHYSFEEMADHGQVKFDADNYRNRFLPAL
jgi:3'-phosphoadenosine 5'-phosphosulfate sulfotransferase (PAPS reductase)/FAD synthetase